MEFRGVWQNGKKFSSRGEVVSEIINLEAILRLPKGTEHFLSDLHGEYEAFCHLVNNCSGVIKEKVDLIFGKVLSEGERRELATCIYYPEEKIAAIKASADVNSWYSTVLYRMTMVARETSRKYTRSKVRKSIPEPFCYIIDEMLHGNDFSDKAAYYDEIFSEIIRLGAADDFVCALSKLIKRLAVDHLHIVGDIFDRGEHPDKIIDMLMEHHSLDIQWGNHDILWMGAAKGSAVCIATVIELCLKYGNIDLLEIGYGISLRELAFFADRLDYDEKFKIKADDKKLAKSEMIIAAKMRKAIFLIMLKLEGQAIARHPRYKMDNRAALSLIDLASGTVNLDGEITPIVDKEDFYGLDSKNPNALTSEEASVVNFLTRSFLSSTKLQSHFRFLLDSGSIYKVYNGNLIFHGCVPMSETGEYLEVSIGGQTKKGRECLDRFDYMVRAAADSDGGDIGKLDIFWYLWCGKLSPLFGRKKLAAFENIYVADPKFSKEEKNAYYTLSRDKAVAEKLLAEFSLFGEHAHIINGHIPVEYARGESPIKAEGKLLVIDGGFCRAYHERTGIAGYTLIYSSYGMRLAAHKPFVGRLDAVKNNTDIVSEINVFEAMTNRLKVADTDIGEGLKTQIEALKALL